MIDWARVLFDRWEGTKMSKGVLGVVAGLAVWLGIVIVAGEIMRLSWPSGRIFTAES